MINLLLFIAGFLIVSSAIKFLFDYKIEISMFITLCSVTIFIAIFAILGALTVGVFAVYAIVILALAYCIYYLIKNFGSIHEIIRGIFTPGTIILLMATFAYFIVIRGKVFVYRDEATAWAIDIKHMFTTGEFYTYTIHPNIMSFFSFLFAKICGYSESNIFLSKWFFMWTCLILPLSNLDWKDWKKTLLYAIGAYCVISIINSAPVYYMDVPLGVVAGALCARWSVSKIRRKDYVWLVLGFIILISIKEELGYAFAGLSAIYITGCSLIRYFAKEIEKRKFDAINTAIHIGLFILILVYLLNSASLGKYVDNLIQKIGYVYLILAIVVFVIVIFGLIGAINGLLKKISNVKVQPTVKNISLGLIGLTVSLAIYKIMSVIYSSLSFEQQKIYYTAINQVWEKGYFGKDAYIFVGLAIILIAITCIALLKKKSANRLMWQTILMLLVIVSYAYSLCFGYVFLLKADASQGLAQFHRYYGIVFVFGGIWLLSRILDGDLKYKLKHLSLIIGLIILSVMIKEFPVPGTVLYSNMENFRYSATYGLRESLDEDSKLISENVKDGYVLILAQPENNEWDPFSAIAWIRYNILPIRGGGAMLTETPQFLDGKYSSDCSVDVLVEDIRNKGYTHVYVYSSGDYFMEKFHHLFEPYNDFSSEYITKTLYKVTTDSKYLCEIIAVDD